MNAIAEKPVDQTDTEFIMPRPAKGQAVLWYHNANPNEQAEVAYVRAVGKRTLVLNIGGINYESVRHVNDPKLKLNAHQRANGAWDLPEDSHARLMPMVSDLQERTQALELLVKKHSETIAALEELIAPKSKAGK